MYANPFPNSPPPKKTDEVIHERGLSNEFRCYANFEAEGVWKFEDNDNNDKPVPAALAQESPASKPEPESESELSSKVPSS